jgi:hypothetical protein
MKVGGGLGTHFAARFQPSTSAAKEILNQVPQVSVPQSPQLSIREVVNASLLQDAESYGPNAGLVPDGSLRSLNEEELLRQIRQLMVAGQLSQSLSDIGDIVSDEHDGLTEGTESQAQTHGISTEVDSTRPCQARSTHTDVSTSGLEGLCDICETDVPGESLGCGDKFCKECLKVMHPSIHTALPLVLPFIYALILVCEGIPISGRERKVLGTCITLFCCRRCTSRRFGRAAYLRFGARSKAARISSRRTCVAAFIIEVNQQLVRSMSELRPALLSEALTGCRIGVGSTRDQSNSRARSHYVTVTAGA